MMQLGKTSMYAILAVLHMAKDDSPEAVQGRTIADAYGIPHDFLLKVLQQLTRAQILKSERGARGGFRLRKSPAEITLLEIVETVEGTINGRLTARESVGGAEGTKEIIARVCGKSAEFTRSLLRATNIKQLIDSDPGTSAAKPVDVQPDRPARTLQPRYDD